MNFLLMLYGFIGNLNNLLRSSQRAKKTEKNPKLKSFLLLFEAHETA